MSKITETIRNNSKEYFNNVTREQFKQDLTEAGFNITDNIQTFQNEYLCKWLEPSQEYQEACKLWLWYNYQCDLYDSKICTGKNEYEDYMPASSEEYKLSRSNAFTNLKIIQDERRKLKEKGIYITEDDWLSAKKHFSRYKLKGLEEEYKYYFKEETT